MYSQNGAFYYQNCSQESQINNEDLNFVITSALDRGLSKIPSLMAKKVEQNFEKSFFNQNDKIMEIKVLAKRLKSNFIKNYTKHEKNLEKIANLGVSIMEKLESYAEYYEVIESIIERPTRLDQSDSEIINLIMKTIGGNSRIKTDAQHQ
jgi:hypothetical protein